MNCIDFFRLQAKNLLRDFKTQVKSEDDIFHYSPRFFRNLDFLIVAYEIDENNFTLMNAQHLIACLAGFNKWSDLLIASKERLELGKLLLEHYDDSDAMGYPILDSWKMYEHLNLSGFDDSFKLEVFKTVFLK
ncbi:MAG: hypothetical protein IJW30_04435 [Clostridia bacterium]|nr:hypothetical protein [Clostridia bacterium]